MHRFLDIIISLSALIFLSPLLIPIILVLKFSGEGEIFYTQKRIGINGRVFGLLKFATMLKNSPNIGSGNLTLRHDPRVLPVGKFLRKSKINELPQLLNIFLGDMSIVGPRPMVSETFEKYPKPAQIILNTVRPGLTGIGSIIFRDEELYLDNYENPIDFYNTVIIPYKSNLEVWYVKNNSIWLYIKIIFITAWVVIFSNSNIADALLSNLPPKPYDLKKIIDLQNVNHSK